MHLALQSPLFTLARHSVYAGLRMESLVVRLLGAGRFFLLRLFTMHCDSAVSNGKK